MAVWLLTNTVGAVATEATAASIMSGYSAYDAISGPRNRTIRASSGANAVSYHYLCPSTQVTHCVVSRMDLFKDRVDATAAVLQYDAANTTDSTTAVGDMELVGITGQDWVKTISRTSDKFRLRLTASSTDHEWHYGKVYFAKGFSFGEEPELGVPVARRFESRVEYARPLYGWEDYAVTESLSLVWTEVTRAKLAEFQSLPLRWPLFLLDDAAALWDHKLEHVILTGFDWQRTGNDSFTVTTQWFRLAHYD